MNKFDIRSMASALASAHNISEGDAEKFLKAVCDVVLDALRSEGQVKIKGLGTFKLIGVPEREMTDVNTGERITIEARNRISFSPDAVLRDIINKPFVFFETVVLNDGVVFEDETDSDDNDEDEEQEDETIDTEVESVKDDSASEEPEADNDTPAETCVNDECSGAEGEVMRDVTEDNRGTADNVMEDNPETSDAVTTAEDDSTDVVPAADNDAGASDSAPVQENNTGEITDGQSETVKEDKTEVSDPAQDSMEGTVSENTSADESEELSRTDEAPAAVNEALKDAKNVMDDIRSGNLSSEDEMPVSRHSENKTRRKIWIIFIVVIVFVAAVGFMFGMYAGGNRLEWFGGSSSVNVTDTAETVTAVTDTVAEDTAAADSIKTDSIMADTISATDSIANDTLVKDGVADPDFYDALDVRVRTGAYRIVGVYKTLTVVKGQTLKSITKAYLGEGMECYMEALNGVKSVQAGDTIKIPELEWRKKKRK